MTAVPVCLVNELIARQLAADPTLPRLTPAQALEAAQPPTWRPGRSRHLSPSDELRAAIVAASLLPLADWQQEKLSLLLHPGRR